jgi:hypothetical protein
VARAAAAWLHALPHGFGALALLLLIPLLLLGLELGGPLDENFARRISLRPPLVQIPAPRGACGGQQQ